MEDQLSQSLDEMVTSLEHFTKGWVERLPSAEYEGILQFIEQREHHVALILAQTLSEDAKIQYTAAIGRILACDPLIAAKIDELKAVEKAGIHKTQNARLQKNSYDTAYAPDSIFFDKKK